MPEPKDPSWNLNARQIIFGIITLGGLLFGTFKYIGLKADQSVVDALTLKVSALANKTEVDSLASKIPTLADKKDVETLRGELNELSAKRREDFVTLKNIADMVGQTNSKIGKIEDNQTWQIQQEVKRLQWQTFKTDPPATVPPNNVTR